MSDLSELADAAAHEPEPFTSSLAPDPWPDLNGLTPTFSGSGAEYFRIWIVNLLLTVATLGIYSAWAKTRRLQYFYRNTRLAGASFDFVGDPKAILRGRILAAVLAIAYHYAFGFSARAGLVTVGLILIGMPFMMRAALRFRLSNTRYRGLPFGFAGSVGSAYLVYSAPLLLLVLPATLVAIAPGKPVVLSAFLLYLLWPFMHGAMKAYQHRHLMYGDQRAAFPLSAARLARTYVLVTLGCLGAVVVSGIALGVAGAMAHAPKALLPYIPMAIAASSYLCFLLGGLLISVRMNNLAWSATSFSGVRIVCDIKALGYLRLQFVNVLLTLLSLGLFRPFAAVRTWRYRVAHLHVHAPLGFEQATLQAARPATSAAGDGFADLLGVDVSW